MKKYVVRMRSEDGHKFEFFCKALNYDHAVQLAYERLKEKDWYKYKYELTYVNEENFKYEV